MNRVRILKKERISGNVIRRLPRYLRKLDELLEKGVDRISSVELGRELGFTPSQVRQDFNNFGGFGQQGYGYPVESLRAQIASILGMDKGYRAILVGVGHIGQALIANFCFEKWGFELVQGFDVDPELIQNGVGNVPVSDMDKLSDYLKANKIDIAVLTVPKEAAKSTADMLIQSGISAIWNFTNEEITPPDSDVIVENFCFSDSLLALSYYITNPSGDGKAVDNA